MLRSLLVTVAGLAWALPGLAAKPEPKPRPEVWLGVALQQDLAFVAGTDVCTKESQLTSDFACFRSSGSQYHGTPQIGVRDDVASGLLVATTRVKLGVDYALMESVTAGLRAGYAFRGGGPAPDGGKKFMPFHLEGRAALWLTGPAYGDGFQVFLFAGGGMAQVDSSIEVTVAENQAVPPPPNQPDNPPVQTLDAYKKTGAGFVELGGGGYLSVGRSHGAVLELGVMQLFPSSGTALALSLGYVFGV